MKYTITIDGMSCGHCVARVKGALEALAAGEVDVSLENKTATLESASAPAELKTAVEDLGFDVLDIAEA